MPGQEFVHDPFPQAQAASRGLPNNWEHWASPLSLKAINAEFARPGIRSLLARGDGYFYFWSGDAADWLERTVRVPSLHAFTMEQFPASF